VAAAVPAAKALFDQASEILGYDLLQVCVEGASARGPPPDRSCAERGRGRQHVT